MLSRAKILQYFSLYRDSLTLPSRSACAAYEQRAGLFDIKLDCLGSLGETLAAGDGISIVRIFFFFKLKKDWKPFRHRNRNIEEWAKPLQNELETIAGYSHFM